MDKIFQIMKLKLITSLTGSLAHIVPIVHVSATCCIKIFKNLFLVSWLILLATYKNFFETSASSYLVYFEHYIFLAFTIIICYLASQPQLTLLSAILLTRINWYTHDHHFLEMFSHCPWLFMLFSLSSVSVCLRLSQYNNSITIVMLAKCA